VFSTIIIISALVLLAGIWNAVQQSISAEDALRQEQETAISSMDFLVSSPGFPEDWENANFTEIYNLGLKGKEGLSPAKLLSLMNFTGDNYTEVKFKAGLAPFDFRLWVSENFSSGKPALSGIARFPVAYFASDSRGFYEVLNAVNETWDYYWGAGSLPQPDWGNSRTHYASNKADAIQKMLENQSNYKSIVIEVPEVLASDVNQTLLQKFLLEGGTLVYLAGNSETEIAIGSLGVFVSNDTGFEAVVLKKGYFLKNARAGANFSSAGKWLAVANESADVFIANEMNSSQAFATAWNYGLGRVYFISDFSADIEGSAGKDVFNLVGWPLDYGIAQNSSAQFVFPISRLSFIESDKRIPVSITLVVWSKWG